MISLLGPFSTVLLIFGGCCANVFALEALIRNQPSSGLLITFLQFAFTSCASYPTQFSHTGQYTLRKPQTPIRKWAAIAAMHTSINLLNNWAFAYNISVPVHIILRSFSSVGTMLAGTLRGKRFSPLQVLSVLLLTIGVAISAWADSQSKGKSMSLSTPTLSSDFVSGLGILLLAQLIAALMGVYVEDVYAEHGANWVESLFYTHFLCLPLFLPFAGTLREQYAQVAATPPLRMKRLPPQWQESSIALLVGPLFERLSEGMLFLAVNVMTQIVCITGVNLLSAKASAVTVTIVLNIRKLVSFIFSTILFDHQLGGMMIFGSTLVFGSGALYGYETSWRLPQQRQLEAQQNGSAHKAKST